MNKYIFSWDSDPEVYKKNLLEWQERDWVRWLEQQLVFPCLVKRVEDEEDAFFSELPNTEPFRLGHTMKALKVEDEDDIFGIIIKVREGRRIGYIPLCDIEFIDPGKNYLPVQEYLAWFSIRLK